MKRLAFLLVILQFVLVGCSFNIKNASSREIELVEKYFSAEEQKLLKQRLSNSGITHRAILGETYCSYIPFYGYDCSIIIYDNEIRSYIDSLTTIEKEYYKVSYDTVTDKILIHELCHVLYPEFGHSTDWIKCFEIHLNSYVVDNAYDWGYYYNSYVASYRYDSYEKYVQVLNLQGPSFR